jgi:site-specific recombinase XerD
MTRRGLARGTIYARDGELRRWLVYIGEPWASATRHDVEDWLDGRPELGARARYTAISHLSAFYRWAIREDLATLDPTTAVERPRLPQQLPRPVPAEQVERIVAGSGDLTLAALLMLDAGLRCCEVAGLRWVDVDLESGVMYVFGKGARERLVGLPKRLRMALYLAAAEATSPWVVGRALTAGRVSQLLGRRFRQLGLRGVTAHRLRHTYATRLYRATAGDLLAVQLALGHSSVATTQIYAAVDADRVLNAARLLDDD